jgi:lipopolysaccharide/colanic/teichoic acid biosynthesis glycosyltransferase
VALALLDACLLLLAIGGAARLRFGAVFYATELRVIAAHPGFLVYAVALLLGLATTFDLYRPERWRHRDQLLVRMAALAVSFAIGLAIGVYLVPPWRFGRGLLALTLVITLVGMTLVRTLWKMAAARPQPWRAVVIGRGPIVSDLERLLRTDPTAPLRIVRHLDAPGGGDDPSAEPLDIEGIDLVIVASLADDAAVDRLAALNFRGTTVVDAAGAYAALTGRIPVRQVDSRWFIATGDFSSLAGSPFHSLQRFLDVGVAVTLLTVTLPVLAVAALVILATDGRPVLYRQRRVGRFREPFVLYKLRTMRRDAERTGPAFAAPNDERVLPAGRFLRRWRIDELPQLVNVIKGDMSLVGPRPERPELAQQLEREIPFYAFRYSVRPGLTGWAQVNIPYCHSTEEHLTKLEFDLYSLRHHGPGMYGVVLLRTLGALVFRPGY